MKKFVEYKNHIIDLFNKIEENESKNIEEAASLIANAIETKNNIFVFGASHAGIISEELFYRAGGLAVINPIFNDDLMLNTIPIVNTSVVEATLGTGEKIFNLSNIKQNDVLLIHSVSGRNPSSIELAIKSKEIGAKVIVITNLEYSKNVSSKHVDDKNLYEYGDVVIDNHGEKGDGCISFPGQWRTLPAGAPAWPARNRRSLRAAAPTVR